MEQLEQTLQVIACRQARVRAHVLAHLAVHGRSYIVEIADGLKAHDKSARIRDARAALIVLEREGAVAAETVYPDPSDSRAPAARRYYWLVSLARAPR